MDTYGRMAALTKSQALHERVMLSVVMRMQDAPYAFKGGVRLGSDTAWTGIEPTLISTPPRRSTSRTG